MAGLRYIPGVVTLTLDESRCTGCGMCIVVCPHAVFAQPETKARITDLDACIECGACAKNCPASALDVRSASGCAVAVINALMRGVPRGSEGDCDCDCA